MVRRFFYLLGALLLTFAASPAQADSHNVGLVRVVHASPDAPEVDVFVDGDAVLEGVAFTDVSNYLEVPAGTYTFAVAPAGQGVEAAVISAEATIAAGSAYTIAAINTLDNISAQIFNDNLGAPAAGKAHVRVLHLSPDAPAVDVKTRDDAVTLVSNLAFPNASQYVPVDAGSYELKVTAAGDTAAVLELDADLSASTIYDVFAVGQLGDGSLELIVDAYQVSGSLPGTGLGEMPLALVAGLAMAVLAGGFMLRRRMA